MNSKSARKRLLVSKRNRLQNQFYKSYVRTLIKIFLNDLQIYKNSQNLKDKEKIQKLFRLISKYLDKGTKRKVFHKNTAARKKSKLAAQLKVQEI